MSTLVSSRFDTVAWNAGRPAVPQTLPAAFAAEFAELSGLVQRSAYVSSTPLGPIPDGAQAHLLPRFTYFGADTNETSPRLAFYAGLDHRDLRSTLGLLHFVRRLALRPDVGHGLYLSVFPLVDVLGLAGVKRDRALSSQSWNAPRSSAAAGALAPTTALAPELDLLTQDARRHGYHGFVRVESVVGDDVVTVCLRTAGATRPDTPSVELLSSFDLSPFAVRWEVDAESPPRDGPLSAAGLSPGSAFELVLRLPAVWSAELQREAAASILKRVVLRYRSFVAHAQHL